METYRGGKVAAAFAQLGGELGERGFLGGAGSGAAGLDLDRQQLGDVGVLGAEGERGVDGAMDLVGPVLPCLPAGPPRGRS
jgi:hypothetical protein